MIDRRWRPALLLVAIVATLAIAIPVLGADPSPSAGPPGQSKPDKSGKPDKDTPTPGKPRRPRRPAKTPEVDVTVEGTVQQGTDGQGRPSFTLTAGGTTWELSAGPPWYWGDKNPLAAYVGKSVKIAGSHHEGETELDVATVDGTAIRAAGKPPWAGGPGSSGRRTPAGRTGWPTESRARAWAAKVPPARRRTRRPKPPRASRPAAEARARPAPRHHAVPGHPWAAVRSAVDHSAGSARDPSAIGSGATVTRSARRAVADVHRPHRAPAHSGRPDRQRQPARGRDAKPRDWGWSSQPVALLRRHDGRCPRQRTLALSEGMVLALITAMVAGR